MVGVMRRLSGGLPKTAAFTEELTFAAGLRNVVPMATLDKHFADAFGSTRPIPAREPQFGEKALGRGTMAHRVTFPLHGIGSAGLFRCYIFFPFQTAIGPTVSPRIRRNERIDEKKKKCNARLL